MAEIREGRIAVEKFMRSAPSLASFLVVLRCRNPTFPPPGHAGAVEPAVRTVHRMLQPLPACLAGKREREREREREILID